MNKKILPSFIIIIVFFVSVGGVIYLTRKDKSISVEDSMLQNKKILIAGKSIDLDIVSTEDEKERGLSGRESLEVGHGMLFLFNQAGRYPFWMKDMKFSIDIIWIGSDMRVTEIVKNALPSSYPAILGGDEDSQYVLEVEANFSDINNLKIGDVVKFTK